MAFRGVGTLKGQRAGDTGADRSLEKKGQIVHILHSKLGGAAAKATVSINCDITA